MDLWAYPERTSCDQAAACRDHLDLGLQFDREQRYEDALREFGMAHKLMPNPRLAVNVGRTLHKLGRFAEALRWYQEAGRAAPADATLQHELRSFVADVTLALRTTRQPHIVLRPNIEVQPAPVHVNPVTTNNIYIDLSQYLPKGTPSTQLTPLHKRRWLWAIGSVVLVSVIGVTVAAWPYPWQPDSKIPSYALFAQTAGGGR